MSGDDSRDSGSDDEATQQTPPQVISPPDFENTGRQLTDVVAETQPNP
jgi:hypothetical protein